jgi:hypothetical protein
MSTATNPDLEADPVRRYTSEELLRQIEEKIEHNIRYYAAQPNYVIAQRIEELRHEWSIERYLQINIGALGILTAMLALGKNRAWGLLTCAGLGFFLYHGIRGFDPPIPLLRRMGMRTRSEIDRELFALKALRGDFDQVSTERDTPPHAPAREIIRAVNS